MNKAKSFDISKQNVIRAWKIVRENKGTFGVDKQSIEEFELNLKDNLYKIWNRMSSGTYFPPPVKAVRIPKSDGKERQLGIPTVSDRVAQAVAKLYLEPIVEPKFHKDSFGYRPNKSALDAVGTARTRCWKIDWVIDLDIKGFFDNLSHDLVMKAVKFHVKEKWLHLYVERWLKAPLKTEDGELQLRDKGTPQGGVISPLLANLFMHHAFDHWMERNFPTIKFERYADDVLLHCYSLFQAQKVLSAVRKRLGECGLELHPEKTKIVYCKDVDRVGSFEKVAFDFLGYSFKPRLSKDKNGRHFVNFSPAVSGKAAKSIRGQIRSWRLHKQTEKSIEEIAQAYNPCIQGWINYYARFYKSALFPTLNRIERYLIRWVMNKYKKYRGHQYRASTWLGRLARRNPSLFAHWKCGVRSAIG